MPSFETNIPQNSEKHFTSVFDLGVKGCTLFSQHLFVFQYWYIPLTASMKKGYLKNEQSQSPPASKDAGFIHFI